MEKVNVSIVITAYNVAEWVGAAVESALAQTQEGTEVIVVEDRSTDGGGTEAAIRALEEAHSGGRLKVIWNKENAGPGLARRYGIEAAKGEYVLLLDGDDWLDPDFVETLLKNGGNADIISGGMTQYFDNGDREVRIYHAHEETNAQVKISAHFARGIVFLNNKLVRRSLYDTVPYSSRRYIEDTPTVVPLLYIANKVVYVEHPGYHYRNRATSISHNSNPTKDTLFRGLCAKDIIEWMADKPAADRLMFRPTLVLQAGRGIASRPKEEIRRVAAAFPAEWKEFTDYLAEVELVRRMFAA